MTPQEKQLRSNVRNYACGMTAQEAMTEIHVDIQRAVDALKSAGNCSPAIASLERLQYLAEFFKRD